MVEENRTKRFRFDPVRFAFCNSNSSNVNAPGAFTFLRAPRQEHFTHFSRLRADYTREALWERSGTRRGKLRRQEIEIYYSFVGKVELSES